MSTFESTTPGYAESQLGAALVVDVREESERSLGYIDGSVHIPIGKLTDFDQLSTKSHSEVILYCATGVRSGIAAAMAKAGGIDHVLSMDGGFERWKSEGRPWTNPSRLSEDQLSRYSRHIVLPGVGPSGQAKLLESKVAVVGAGGLGSPVVLYLAAAGIGTVGLIDHDTVDASNLQRQVIHTLDQVGKLKVDSARERVSGLNPDVKVELAYEELTATNAEDTLSGYDVIVDATDNFPTRYLINDVSLRLRIPVVHASIYRFEGQVSVFDPYRGPCYRCLFPAPPPADIAVSCETGGVFGVLPGVVGSLQATEALKTVMGLGSVLNGRLMIYDGLNQTTSELQFHRDPECIACGDETNPPALVDYDASCLPT